MRNFDVAIVGSGPSALMCAINLSPLKVIVLEKNNQIGGKIKYSGGGRCNVTNLAQKDELLQHIVRNNKFLYSALHRFDNNDIIDFFNANKFELRTEDHNRVFPKSGKSQDVIDLFASLLEKNNVLVNCNYEVQTIEQQDDLLIINKQISAKRVVIATGGISHSHLGTTGDGYRFAKQFGLEVVDCFPTESPLISNDPVIQAKELQGISIADAKCELYVDKKKKKTVTHDLLITHFGLSGPAALHLSYDVKLNAGKETIVVVTAPNPSKRLAKFLDEDMQISFVINDVKGFKTAFVTAGGVSLKEINPKSFSVKKNDQLYFIGEVLDINAHTGGYNITICFSEGYNCAQEIKKTFRK